ncbi:hypothetical protein KL918_001120 [Ogataea parapolymorpha]|uniref:Membrane protein n=1 Tax=Ogataea parapolymorpha (strain ATCC 26012 / BCRC 20466 / JCM 22074 / NRRL Y-7560 / DL-1) TaxID=871575 RepID=W1Q9L7_OGAPD|nr:putative membrane protein [Ogataea parapolymorpha DL-1]ESW97506.1 putative membrane protein [Ogataea parapolymorpha DL-1]KAG7869575.1 hypothetical protein KL918_001120 [Ogataea parapolymorpha]KAG7875372.1 hypothetical protein KL916_000043 [Ogataea parapolymorpha]
MVSAYVRYLSPTWGVVAALLGGFLFLETFATPFHRQFYVPDPRISYPYTADSIPDARLAVYACVVPCVLIVLATATQYLRSSRDQKQRIVHLANVSCLALALALGLNGFVTEFIKVKVGRPRPDFLDRCGLSPKSPVPGLYTVADCTAPYGEKALQDGFKSFPSGHSSFAWCGMNFLNLWISGHYRLYTGRSGFSVSKLVPLGPALVALHICISRSQDYKHDALDITCGSLLGLAASWWSYRQFFPSVADDSSDLPLVPAQEPVLPV